MRRIRKNRWLLRAAGTLVLAAVPLLAAAQDAPQKQDGAQSNEALAAPEVADPAYHAQEVALGQALVEKHCARCHAIGTKDASPHKDAPPFRDVVTRYPAEHLAEALAEGIQSGHPDMPVFVFEPDEIDAFLAYLDSLAPPAER